MKHIVLETGPWSSCNDDNVKCVCVCVFARARVLPNPRHVAASQLAVSLAKHIASLFSFFIFCCSLVNMYSSKSPDMHYYIEHNKLVKNMLLSHHVKHNDTQVPPKCRRAEK
jgi:hypothetical protein